MAPASDAASNSQDSGTTKIAKRKKRKMRRQRYEKEKAKVKTVQRALANKLGQGRNPLKKKRLRSVGCGSSWTKNYR